VEARDASGKVIGRDHVETIASGRLMLPAFGLITLASFAAVYAAPQLLVGWPALLLIVFASIAGVVCIASLGFALWGKLLGFPWHFTP